jgi:hypothetical protein
MCCGERIAGRTHDEVTFDGDPPHAAHSAVLKQRLGEVVKSGELPGSVHCIGQEAVAVGVCSMLTEQDWIASTHVATDISC